MSSITDKPISHQTEDLLKVEKYSQALSNFITRSDTPITIGLQGEWGTGKTSLMSLLLEDFNQKNIACSWVNTWEYAMFKEVNETTPNVLKGMLENLKTASKQRGVWTLKDKSQENFKKATRFIGSLANQVISRQTGIDIKDAASGIDSKTEEVAAEIAQIKGLINDIISELINDSENPIEKVVFFVDDLDRIPPGDAVEVLEALKNIFDIPNCVFILAIDYEVVVKGLEQKFGPKTEQNEREFRSFFDKIIQVPFTMPVGTYDIENFLVEKLYSLNLPISDANKEYYTSTIKYTIGYNPRSLKRYLNSFSLINHLRELEDSEASELDNLMLFALLGVQISYPKIFRILAQMPDFTSWNKGFAYKNGIEWDTVKERLDKYGENDLIDEEWEQACWAFCQTDSYLKARAFSVLELFNMIREKFGNDLNVYLEKAMEFAAITNVDDDMSAKQEVQKIGNKTVYKGLETKLNQLAELGFNAVSIEAYNEFWTPLEKLTASDSRYRISFAKSGSGFYNETYSRGKNQLFYCNNPSKGAIGTKIWVKRNIGKVKEYKAFLESTYCLENSESIYISNEKDLILEPGLFNELGETRYKELLSGLHKVLTF